MQDPRPVIAQTRRSARAPSRTPARANARFKLPPFPTQNESEPHLSPRGDVCLMKKILVLGLIACAAAFNATSARGVAPQAGAQVYARDGARFALEGRLS